MNKIKDWFNNKFVSNVIGGTIGSKKVIASVLAVIYFYRFNQKYALIAFVFFILSQTAVDITEIIKNKK